ncbi:hypothetical protein HPB47_026690 [Ixodes persulcatus]|uniref:Uncharacterized protein n=1 Tax=Ixodes persulcatus TaxID=34615 RepID=A0AC60PZ95_IXOPE|nr:hypothetical protein HPB47_026690 [Ixodes persulcatus]
MNGVASSQDGRPVRAHDGTSRLGSSADLNDAPAHRLPAPHTQHGHDGHHFSTGNGRSADHTGRKGAGFEAPRGPESHPSNYRASHSHRPYVKQRTRYSLQTR